MRKTKILGLVCLFVLSSCGTDKLVTRGVEYTSLRTAQYKNDVPKDAKIVVNYYVRNNGVITANVKNMTDEIMIIDQTKSFFVNSDGHSTSYYDPTVRTTSTSTMSSSTGGANVNLGAVAGVFGVGGVIGGLLNGVSVGESSTGGTSTTNATYVADLPQVSLGPKGTGMMSKEFTIRNLVAGSDTDKNNFFTPDNSACKFSICISYSINGGQSFEKLVTDFYVNAWIVSMVKQHGKVNDALRNVMQNKTDLFHEQWWSLTVKGYTYDNLVGKNVLIDWQ